MSGHLLSTYCVPHSTLATGDAARSKMGRVPALLGLTAHRGTQTKIQYMFVAPYLEPQNEVLSGSRLLAGIIRVIPRGGPRDRVIPDLGRAPCPRSGVFVRERKGRFRHTEVRPQDKGRHWGCAATSQGPPRFASKFQLQTRHRECFQGLWPEVWQRSPQVKAQVRAGLIPWRLQGGILSRQASSRF